MAEDFSRKREFVSEDLKKLTEEVKEGERILDSGCGNGRLFKILKEKKVNYYGIDFSEKLIEMAKNKFPEAKFLVADCLNLPFPDNFFDKVFSISVFHHIPSQELRVQYLKEIKRVLKPGGILILRVWNFWKKKEGLKLILKFAFLKILGKTKLDFFDIFFPWKNSKGNVIVQRYFHCFRKKELEKIAKKVNFKIIQCWVEGKEPASNIYLKAKKI